MTWNSGPMMGRVPRHKRKAFFRDGRDSEVSIQRQTEREGRTDRGRLTETDSEKSQR